MKTFSRFPTGSESLQTVSCPVCGNLEFSFRWRIEGARFVTCRSCGLVIQNPRPIFKDLVTRYDGEYFRYEIENEENFFQLMMKGLNDASLFEHVLPTLPPIKRILDIGCATGRLLCHFKSLNWQTCGVELCTESAEYGNEKYGVNIQIGDLQELSFSDEYFSVIHASHLIEHVDNPANFVNEIMRILTDGGVFICVTPTMDGFQAWLHGSAWRSVIPDHVTLFRKRTLKKLLSDAGFSIEIVKTWGGLAVGTAPLWLKKNVDKWVKSIGWGDVVLMVARKNGPLHE